MSLGPVAAAVRLDALRRAARDALPGDEAALEADLLIAEALGRPRAWLFAHPEAELSGEPLARARGLLAERARGVPVAHLLGRRAFWTLELAVDRHTLIPRPETELLVEAALARLPSDRSARAADLGTGSGAIALALAVERPLLDVVAVDVSEEALGVARANAERLRLERVDFRIGDWFGAMHRGERFDLIASNPPYLAEDDPHLAEGDLRFEPRAALVSGVDGLDAIRRIVAAAPVFLRGRGWLLLEHGLTQGTAVRDLLATAGLVAVETLRDLEGRDRVSLGRAP